MKQYKSLIIAAWFLTAGLGSESSWSLYAQSEILAEKRLGIYFSSREFDFTEDYYLPITQFLKIEEDRSFSGNMKSELLIRIGEMLTQQLGKVTNADTVHFINADIKLGQRFMQIYQAERSRIITGTDNLDNLDYVLVVDSIRLNTRTVRSVYIRSNRMIPDKITVKRAKVHISIYDPQKTSAIWGIAVCFDEHHTAKVDNRFDFYNQKSPMGKFLAKVFSQWWYQMEDGQNSNCD